MTVTSDEDAVGVIMAAFAAMEGGSQASMAAIADTLEALEFLHSNSLLIGWLEKESVYAEFLALQTDYYAKVIAFHRRLYLRGVELNLEQYVTQPLSGGR